MEKINPEFRASHIFSNTRGTGHLMPETFSSKVRALSLFDKVASNPSNLIGIDKFGVSTYRQLFRNGEVWVEMYKGTIRSAGVNYIPK
ncbi:MAG TPA: hypothetical protein VLZ11_02770 [Flavobacterium sp.]|nr:hypothetical protein [Flavobacterium sp.]